MSITINRLYVPQLAKMAPGPFDSENHLFEPKYDGIRCIAYVTPNGHKLVNRSLIDITDRFPEIVFPDKTSDYVLDGELVCKGPNDIPNFQLMQTRMNRKRDVLEYSKRIPAKYYAFDMLEYAGMSLVDNKVRLHTRKDMLTAQLPITEHISYAPYYVNKCFWMLEEYKGWEGLIAKEIDSPYREGMRTSEWLKIKPRTTKQVWVLGASEGRGKRAKAFGALIIAEKRQTYFKKVGEVGTGYTDEQIRRLVVLLNQPVVSTNPLSRLGYAAKYVCEPFAISASYLEVTTNGQWRFPSFEGFIEE